MNAYDSLFHIVNTLTIYRETTAISMDFDYEDPFEIKKYR